jgi:hypothetical protein
MNSRIWENGTGRTCRFGAKNVKHFDVRSAVPGISVETAAARRKMSNRDPDSRDRPLDGAQASGRRGVKEFDTGLATAQMETVAIPA